MLWENQRIHGSKNVLDFLEIKLCQIGVILAIVSNFPF